MAVYDPYDRSFLTKNGNSIDEAEVKSKKRDYALDWADFDTKMTKTLESLRKRHKKRRLDKIEELTQQYGKRMPDRAKCESATVSHHRLEDYINKKTKLDPNQEFRLHKRGGMDRLKGMERRRMIDDDF